MYILYCFVSLSDHIHEDSLPIFYEVEPQKVLSKLRAMLLVSEGLSANQKGTIPIRQGILGRISLSSNSTAPWMILGFQKDRTFLSPAP
jgi:hypothetical protein